MTSSTGDSAVQAQLLTMDDDSRSLPVHVNPDPKTTTLSAQSSDTRDVKTRFLEDCHETDMPSPKLKAPRILKDKVADGSVTARQEKKPLQLLDLPVDILKDIVKEVSKQSALECRTITDFAHQVTHTNDLTSLALCHSALHALAIPHIYSRFDIVWPDSSIHAEPRTGVDALTYGLATLVMAEEVFGEASWQVKKQTHLQTQETALSLSQAARDAKVRRRRGNYYAHFTKKFSLGNGPPEWVQEYLINKEGGKMLGTLVALAVARMRSLETFVWDMPTGVLRDVWMALSSLEDRVPGQECRLERVWIRWHDNFAPESGHTLQPHHPSDVGVADPVSSLDRVEHPSFSILPPLKSLSVLDIDELQYLDEMSVLIGRSQEKLRELRVGIARHAMNRHWAQVWEGNEFQQVDVDKPTQGPATIGERRLGGVLGVLTGFVSDMRQRRDPPVPVKQPRRRPNFATVSQAQTVTAQSAAQVHIPSQPHPIPLPTQAPVFEDTVAFASSSGITSLRDVLPDGVAEDLTQRWETDVESSSADAIWTPVTASVDGTPRASIASMDLQTDGAADLPAIAQLSLEDRVVTLPPTPEPVLQPQASDIVQDQDLIDPADSRSQLVGKLGLENLELERVPLSVEVLQHAIDWSKLTSLTLLHCQTHESLWKALRREYSPLSCSEGTTDRVKTRSNSSSRPSSDSDSLRYPLKLKKIHTNTVSSSLISFIKETLAPNSLEVVFFQEARAYASTVNVDSIFRGVIKRHRSSLTKILIDSRERGADGQPTASTRWKRWILNRDILKFITSGKMPALKELGMALDYRDWVSHACFDMISSPH